MSKVNRVAIVGGTHGNEYSGIYLLRQWQKNPEIVNRESFHSSMVLANPQAHEQNQRYVDCDLNRQFLPNLLADSELNNIEQTRAKQINNEIGPRGDAQTDFIIDLHNTTSNMGPSLILLQSDAFNLRMAAYLKMKMPEAVIVLEDEVPLEQQPYLCAIARQGVIVEIGPQPQSVLRHDVLEWMQTMTKHLLDYVHLHNIEQLPVLPDELQVYSYVETLKLPEDEQGNRMGMVHRHVQDRDFHPVKPGEPIIALFDGGELVWEGDYEAYPHFINEAAYYDNNLAMSMAKKLTIDIPE
ncbi:aspartoacylase [Planctobacterium marinum]|uniref:Aspartoacylase n=1 Tax=Planctobacterium marinum TaxID=1631968 RepID=A0AA48HJI7_9ALTE|nr:putative aspartoacylase [Planctobacterium marinum]